MKLKSAYIANPVFDNLFFIFIPVIGFFVGAIVSETWLMTGEMGPEGNRDSIGEFIIGLLLAAHLIITFIRSHGNQSVFKMFPIRFTIVPVILFLGMYYSNLFLIIMGIITTFLDEWHSSQQTFGIGRIYDSKAGNDPSVGRKLDMGLNFVFWMGPILGGVNLIEHAHILARDVKGLSELLFTSIPVYAESNQQYFTWGCIITCVVYLCFYLYRYRQLSKDGYQISQQKLALYISTGFCSIFAWSFFSFGVAYIMVNIYHIVQYFAIVWLQEKGSMMDMLETKGMKLGKELTILMFLLIPILLATALVYSPPDSRTLIATAVLLNFLHFWYDGFIWSVRKNMV